MKIKKILALFCAAMMVLSLAACGGEDGGSDEVTMKTITLGDVTMEVPDTFGEPQEANGAMAVAGPEASITVSGPVTMDIPLESWTEEFVSANLDGLFGASYTDLALADFVGDVDFDGTPGVFFTVTGTNSKGVARVIYNAYLFDETMGDYVVSFLHSVDNASYTAELDNAIVSSITLH